MSKLVAAAGAAALVMLPRIAEACPACAGSNGSSMARAFLIGSMMAAPFIAIAVAVPLIIRMARRSDGDSEE